VQLYWKFPKCKNPEKQIQIPKNLGKNGKLGQRGSDDCTQKANKPESNRPDVGDSGVRSQDSRVFLSGKSKIKKMNEKQNKWFFGNYESH
jgi:hypothetical protein